MKCACIERVFHDVPYTAGFKNFENGKLVDQVHSTVMVNQ